MDYKIKESEIVVVKHEFLGTVRVVNYDNEVWFVARDVIKALGIEKANTETKCSINSKGKTFEIHWDEKTGCVSPIRMMNESMLYSFILMAETNVARMFKIWLADEILPKMKAWEIFDIDHLASVISTGLNMMYTAEINDDNDQRFEEIKDLVKRFQDNETCEIVFNQVDVKNIIKEQGLDKVINPIVEFADKYSEDELQAVWDYATESEEFGDDEPEEFDMNDLEE